jgi:chemotaxis protein MotB
VGAVLASAAQERGALTAQLQDQEAAAAELMAARDAANTALSAVRQALAAEQVTGSMAKAAAGALERQLADLTEKMRRLEASEAVAAAAAEAAQQQLREANTAKLAAAAAAADSGSSGQALAAQVLALQGQLQAAREEARELSHEVTTLQVGALCARQWRRRRSACARAVCAWALSVFDAR